MLETIIETIISRNILANNRERNCEQNGGGDSAFEGCPSKERENEEEKRRGGEKLSSPKK